MELRSPGWSENGVYVVANLKLRRSQKITVALGQRGEREGGSGGSFLTLETPEGPKPLLIAGGPACGDASKDFCRGQLGQAGGDNNIPGSSGVQEYFENDHAKIYCAGAGFVTGPHVTNLDEKYIPPGSYSEGLVGGKRYDNVVFRRGEGGFGGGGVCSMRSNGKYYYGAGGGFTGGAHRRNGDEMIGGGGGSFSSVPNAVFAHHGEGKGKCTIKLLSD